MLHTLSPYFFEIEALGIRLKWYGLSYFLSFLIFYFFIKFLIKHKRVEVKKEMLFDIFIFGAIGVFIGGRFGYILFYEPNLIISFSKTFPYWWPLAIHKGGMSNFGGILGVTLTYYFLAKKYSLNFKELLDIAATIGPLGICLGRVANFINGEFYGRITTADNSWAVKFPTEMYHWLVYQPEKLKSLAPILKLDEFKQLSNLNKALIDKVILESQNNNHNVIEILKAILPPRYPSQLYQAFLEGFLVFSICLILWRMKLRKGTIAIVFAVMFSSLRLIGEQYRMPIGLIGFDPFGLTRGQVLSIGLLCITMIILITHKNKRYPGL